MENKKKYNFIIPLVIYPFDVMVSFGQSDDELRKELKKFKIEWNDEMKCVGIGRFCMTEKNQSIIRMNIIPKTCAEYGTLQHEIFHCVTHVLDRMGLKFKLESSEEAYAYLIGYLTAEIYLKINQ